MGNYRMIRNPKPDGPSCVYTGEDQIFDESKFIPVPVKKGKFMGQLVWVLPVQFAG